MGETIVVAAATVPKCCSLRGPRRLLFGKGPAAGNGRPAGTGGCSLTMVWIVLCLIMRRVIFQQTAKETLCLS